MKIKKRYIILLFILLYFIKWKYDKYTVDRDKNLIVDKLESYRQKNLRYPVDLSEIEENVNKKFNYKTDSLTKSFRLIYLEGFMDANCIYYDSRKGIWKSEFTY